MDICIGMSRRVWGDEVTPRDKGIELEMFWKLECLWRIGSVLICLIAFFGNYVVVSVGELPSSLCVGVCVI